MNNIPTIATLYSQVKSDIETEFGITISTIGKSFLRIFAGVHAGKLYLIYLGIAQVQKNIWIDTAEPAAVGGSLERYGLAKLGRLPFGATQGKYDVTVTGNVGATIQVGTLYKSDDSSLSPGMLYRLDTAFTFTGTTGTISLRALTAGVVAKLEVGNTLTATAPLPLVNQGCTVTAETVAPRDAEDIEDYRQKGITAFRLEPQGGAPADYRIWGLDAQGVQQIYPYATTGQPNEVDVYVEATIVDSTDGKGTPTTTIMDDVYAVIELDPDTTLSMTERSRRPITVINVNVKPIIPLDIDIVIPGGSNFTTQQQTVIDAAITEHLEAIRPFIAACDAIEERNDVASTNNINGVIYAAVPGLQYGALELWVNGVQVSSYQFNDGDIPYLNSISYV